MSANQKPKHAETFAERLERQRRIIDLSPAAHRALKKLAAKGVDTRDAERALVSAVTQAISDCAARA